MSLSDKDAQRFWSKVNKTDTCWLWTSQTRGGYGIFRLNNKIVSAHRLSYHMAHGEPGGRQVCHSCDVRNCVNPKHLFLGSAKTNSDDKMIKDRHGFALSNEQVLDMRSRKMHPDICRELAKEFNINTSQVKRILTGESYGWLDGAVEVPPQNAMHKLSAKEIEEILKALKKPYWGQVTDLANKYNVAIATISHIKRGRIKSADTQ